MTPPSRPGGCVLALFSCKGGVGTTFLTTQLGSLLALRWQLKVLIIDGVHPFGDAALMLSQDEPRATLGDLLAHPERFDDTLLESSLLWPHPQLGVLAAAENPLQNLEMNPDWLQSLLKIARERFDCILFDCGRAVDPRITPILHAADRLLPVLQTSLSMIRDGRRLLSALISLGINPAFMLPVLNRATPENTPQPKTLERALGARIRHRIPEDACLVNDCIQGGYPVWTRAPFHPLTQSLVILARALILAPEPCRVASRNLLQRWWKKQWRWNPQHL